ncbi:MAG: hypothetical protein JNM62_01105 [Flavobacteriales bacterium]|nr:hypothetical protein [Flavobacteriales bacterium]
MKRLIPLLILAMSASCTGTPKKDAQPNAAAADTVKASSRAPDGHQIVPLRAGGEMEGMMRNGKRHGLWVSRFPNGVLRSRTNYVNGVEEGAVEVFHANSITYYKGQHLHGKPVGEWVFADTTGKAIKRVVYDNMGNVVRQ